MGASGWTSQYWEWEATLLPRKKTDLFYLCVSLLCLRVCYMCVGACGSQIRLSSPWVLELQVVIITGPQIFVQLTVTYYVGYKTQCVDI